MLNGGRLDESWDAVPDPAPAPAPDEGFAEIGSPEAVGTSALVLDGYFPESVAVTGLLDGGSAPGFSLVSGPSVSGSPLALGTAVTVD